MKREIKTTLALDGEKEFKQAVSEINRELKVLGTEMDKVTAEFGDNAKGMEALASKQKVYNKQIDEQKKKIEELKRALANSEQEFGKNDRRTKEWQISLNRAEASLVKMERSLESNNKELEKASNKMEQFSRKANEMGQNLKSIGDKMTGAGRTMSMAVTAPIVAAGVASFKFAADLEDAQGAADQIFKNSSKEIQSWADGLKSHYGIAETEALTYANTMGAMLQNIGGLSEAEAAKMSGQLVELAGDLTAMFGGTTEDAVRALTGALKGNNTMLDNYGMAVNDALVKQKALDMGLIKGKEGMTLQAKQVATLALIMEQSAAAQGQAAREADGASGSMRAFQTEVKNLSTDIGEILLPIITPLIASVRDLAKKFGEMSPASKKMVVVIAGLAAAIGPVLIGLGMVAKAMGSIMTVLPQLGKAFGAIKKVSGIFKGIGIAAKFLMANPIILVIAGVIAAAYLIYKNWDKISKQLAETWTWIKEKVASIWGGIKDFFAENWNAIKSTMVQKWNDIKNWLVNFVAGFKQAVSDKISSVKTAVSGVWDAVKTTTINIWSEIKGFIAGAIDGIVSTISGLFDKLDQLKLKAKGVKEGVSYTFTGSGSTMHWASGTNFHPGGLAWVGERGPELLDLPRGSKVYNNQQSMAMASQNLTIGGTVRVEGVNNMNQLVGVAEIIAKQIEQGDRRLAGRVRVMPSMA